jgi:hypothetical protein
MLYKKYEKGELTSIFGMGKQKIIVSSSKGEGLKFM